MSTNTPFLIGVIRSQEKGLLEDDEFTRIINAPSSDAALHVLKETPYGQWLGEKLTATSALTAIDHRLADTKNWLLEQLQAEPAKIFISAREEALNANTQDWNKVSKAFLQNLQEIAATPLQKKLVKFMVDKTATDEVLRRQPNSVKPGEMARELEKKNYPGFSVAMLEAVINNQDATSYEKQWDEVLLAMLRQHAADVTGEDAVIAFWYVLELEAKQLRLLLSAKLQGVTQDELAPLKRSLFRERV